MVRLIVALLLIGASCFVSYNYVEHHEKGAMESLYMHLMPAPLITGGHGEPSEFMLYLPLPESMAAFANGTVVKELDGDKKDVSVAAFTNLQLFQVLSVLLIFVLLSGIPKHLRTGQGDVLTRFFAGFALWVRDDIVFPVMGKERGGQFLPYFMMVFFFIMFMNVLGLVPGSATATASIYVTAGLALTTLIAMIGCGMVAQGPIAFWKNLVPHVPLAIWPLMFFVEVFGLMVKPIALTIRLFANMTGGHLVVLSFIGLIFTFAQLSPVVGYGSAPFAVGFAIFIMIIESFVALLQAYIFTQLSVLFVDASVHPEH